MQFGTETWSIQTFLQKEAGKELSLQPDFQRFYIWNKKKEQAFIDSILRDFPVPPMWIWRRDDEDGNIVHDVIDGQQRLTCIKPFLANEFPFKSTEVEGDEHDLAQFNGCYFDKSPAHLSAPVLPKKEQNRIKNYSLNHILVSTSKRGLVIDVFKRLNQSATTLTPQELRNAFYSGKFKALIYRKVAELQQDSYWGAGNRVFMEDTTDRMGTQQFASELMVGLMEGAPQDKSDKLDRYYEAYDDKFTSQAEFEKRFNEALHIIQRTLTESSRFTQNLSDFYTLFLLVDELNQKQGIKMLSDVNLESMRSTLYEFEDGYAEFLEGRGSERTGSTLFEDYRETVVGRQKEKEIRELRRALLKGLIEPGLEQVNKDRRRLFSDEQKLYIWQKSKDKACALCGKAIESFDDYEPDHIKAWDSGGPTTIANGQVTHASCNRAKKNKEPVKKS